MEFALYQIGLVRSSLIDLNNCPKQGEEGAPDAWIEIDPNYAASLRGVVSGQQLVVLTWLHLADRSIQEVHPRGDKRNPLTGVFATRSPDRPNPIGLHTVTVLEISGTRLLISPLEALDQTPVIDIKIHHNTEGGDTNPRPIK